MRCKSCHYSLANLTGPPHRCPECGREFDPNDPLTFDVPRPDKRALWIRGAFLIACGYAVTFCLTYQFLDAYNTRVGVHWSQSEMLREAVKGGLLFIPIGMVPVLIVYGLARFIMNRRKQRV